MGRQVVDHLREDHRPRRGDQRSWPVLPWTRRESRAALRGEAVLLEAARGLVGDDRFDQSGGEGGLDVVRPEVGTVLEAHPIANLGVSELSRFAEQSQEDEDWGGDFRGHRREGPTRPPPEGEDETARQGELRRAIMSSVPVPMRSMYFAS